MARLSPTSIAAEGFRLMRDYPVAVGVWAGVIAVAAAVAIGLIAATVGFAALSNFPALMQAAQTDAEPDPAMVLSMLSGFFVMLAIVIVITVVVEAVLVTAVKRAVLRPDEPSTFFMRLGMDEVRTFAVVLVRAMMVWALCVVVFALALLLGRLIHPAVGVLLGLAALPGLAYVWVKLSLAVSQSFAERRFVLFGSWTLLRGQFWPVLGAYVLALIFYFIISIVISTIAGIAGGNAFTTAIMQDPENVDFSALGSVLGVTMMVNVVASLITKVFELPVLGAPPAAAYRDLTDSDAAAQF